MIQPLLPSYQKLHFKTQPEVCMLWLAKLLLKLPLFLQVLDCLTFFLCTCQVLDCLTFFLCSCQVWDCLTFFLWLCSCQVWDYLNFVCVPD